MRDLVFNPGALFRAGVNLTAWILAILLCGTDYTFKEDALHDVLDEAILCTVQEKISQKYVLTRPRFNRLVYQIHDRSLSMSLSQGILWKKPLCFVTVFPSDANHASEIIYMEQN